MCDSGACFLSVFKSVRQHCCSLNLGPFHYTYGTYSIRPNLVAGNVRLATIEGVQGEAALLQLRLGIVPLHVLTVLSCLTLYQGMSGSPPLRVRRVRQHCYSLDLGLFHYMYLQYYLV
jgi:hypothetical protein